MKKEEFKPYISDEHIQTEFTPTAIIIGILLSVVFGAANAYLGLRVGLTISASIPAAVISMGVLRIILRKNSILESNMVQTIGSAGESLAAGSIFTMPVLFLWSKEGLTEVPSLLTISLLAFFGGILGILFMVPLRNALIVKEHYTLPYPEGTACAEVLLAGESNNSAFSTPGNAQLVDDKENDDTKQFLTIQTKKGNTFYMVIDRSSNTENVYMMSLVDENDLAEFLDETEKDKETEESTVVIPETAPETTPAEEETEVKKEEKSGMNVKGFAAIVVAAILGFAGIAVYKKHGRSKDEDYVSEQLEFSDGPYVNEEDDEKEE